MAFDKESSRRREARAARDAEELRATLLAQAEELRATLLAQAEEAFWESPRGRARAAKRAGQRWFQIELPVQETAWSWRTRLERDWGRTGHTGEHGLALGEIEEEGWEFVRAGWLHPETSPSGQGSLPGSRGSDIVGVYLFKTSDAASPEDEPWLRAVEELDAHG